MNEQLRDILAGTMAGFTSKIVEYPFDTVKVRLQTNTGYRGGMDCARMMVQNEGRMSLFKGMSAPLVGAMLENAIVFWGYGLACRLMMGNDNTDNRPNSAIAAVGGSVSGLFVSLWYVSGGGHIVVGALLFFMLSKFVDDKCLHA